MDAIVFVIGRLLAGSVDWKLLYQEQGEPAVRAKLTALYNEKLADDLPRIAEKMEGEGWNWTSAADLSFLRGQKVDLAEAQIAAFGPGGMMSRDALFAIFDKLGVPGGAVKDGLRDGYDDPLWKNIAGQVPTGAPVLQIVQATAAELIRIIL